MVRLSVVRVLWGVSVGAVFWGSIAPLQLPFSEVVSWGDKVIHTGAYLWLAALGRLSLPRANGGLWALLSMIALGWGIEGIQMYVPGRDGSLADGACNMVGAICGLFCAEYLSRLLQLESGGYSVLWRRNA